MRRVGSAANEHYRSLLRLFASARERRRSGRILLDGLHLVDSYVQSWGPPEEVVVSESASHSAEIAAWIATWGRRTTLTVVPDALLAKLSTVEAPSGIVAVVARPAARRAADPESDAVLLDGLQDPGNVGSILRSAAAAGFAQVLLSADCAQAWSPKTLRAAMGAHFQLAIHEDCDLAAFLGGYRGRALVTAPDALTSVFDARIDGPLAWVFGHEGQGVRAALLDVTRARVRIPMPGGSESLNVAAAAAICLFETVRRRLADPSRVASDGLGCPRRTGRAVTSTGGG